MLRALIAFSASEADNWNEQFQLKATSSLLAHTKGCEQQKPKRNAAFLRYDSQHGLSQANDSLHRLHSY